MVSFSGTLERMFNSLGIRWTNTDEPRVMMSAERALRNPAVWYAVSRISGNVAQMPLNVHRIVGRNIEKLVDHDGYRIFRVQPNAYQVPMVFKRQMMEHALLWGNAFAYIRRDGNRIAELIPLLPDRMEVGLVNGEKVFVYVPDLNERISLWEQLTDDETKTISFDNNEIWHIQGLGSDGLKGHSLISMARDAWEAGNAATRRNLSQMRKGHSGGVVLEVPAGQLRDETKAQQFLEAWRRDQDGENNAGKTAMLREGIKANVLAMSNRDAEFVSTLVYMRQEEALRFLLEGILGDDNSVSYNSYEQKVIAYLQNCLNPWLRMIEEECDVKLLTEQERTAGIYFKFNEGALIRSDKKTTMDMFAIGLQNKIYSRNEVREALDLNPVEGGDVFENPAITPGNPNEEQLEDDNSSPDEPAANNPASNRSASTIMLERLCKIEAQRAVQAAASSRNFCDWMDKFYAKWEQKLADDIEAIGGDRDLATSHCQESKRRLLACADTATPETLEAVVRGCVENWESRAVAIVNEMELCHV